MPKDANVKQLKNTNIKVGSPPKTFYFRMGNKATTANEDSQVPTTAKGIVYGYAVSAIISHDNGARLRPKDPTNIKNPIHASS